MDKFLGFVGQVLVGIFIVNVVILMAFGPFFFNEETEFSGLMSFYKIAYYILWIGLSCFGGFWFFTRYVK